MSKEDKRSIPMDPSIIENKTPIVKPNQSRVCHAIKQLNEEVWALFPETPVEYSDYTGRNVALGVVYDLSSLDAGDVYDFVSLMNLLGDETYNVDPRIAAVMTDKDNLNATVVMKASARTQDKRDPFGLADAYSVLTQIEDGGSASETTDDVFDGGGA